MISTICDWIVLCGAVCGAILGIYKFFSKPTHAIHRRLKKSEEERIGEVLQEKIPKILETHDAARDAKTKQDFIRLIQPELDKIQLTNKLQSEKLDRLGNSSKDLLRFQMISIYNECKWDKKITETQREVLDQLYADYRAHGGNGAIERMYNRTLPWEIVPDEE